MNLSINTGSLKIISLPPNLQVLNLQFSNDFRRSMYSIPHELFEQGGVLPQSLKKLTIDSKNSSDEISITSTLLPRNLTYLSLHSKLRLFKGCFPNTLTELYLVESFQKPIAFKTIPPDMIPKSVTKLTLGMYRVIEPGSIPNSVTYLCIKNQISEPMDIKCLPSSLIHLKLYLKYYRSSANIQFPPKLKYFACTVPSPRTILDLLPTTTTLTHLYLSCGGFDTYPTMNNTEILDQPIPLSVTYLRINYNISIPAHIKQLVLSNYENPQRSIKIPNTVQVLKLVQHRPPSDMSAIPKTLKCLKLIPLLHNDITWP